MADNLFTRTRSTRSTARRLVNVRILLEHLLVIDELSFDEISLLLKLSPSGSRKYIKDLRQSGLLIVARIDCVGSQTHGTTYFRLCNNKEKVRKALDLILETTSHTPIAKSVRTPLRGSTDGRNFHIMLDDTEYQIKTPAIKPPKHDDLMSLFYGLHNASPTT